MGEGGSGLKRVGESERERVGEGGRGWERVGEGGRGWERVGERLPTFPCNTLITAFSHLCQMIVLTSYVILLSDIEQII